MSFFSRLFGHGQRDAMENRADQSSSEASHKGRRDPPMDIDLKGVPSIVLPKAPNPWEIDGRQNRAEEHFPKEHEAIIRASWSRQFTKVLKLAEPLNAEQLTGAVGEHVAKAYVNIILKRVNAEQFVPAARWADEMLNRVPAHCTDTDRRRFNKIVAALDKTKAKHAYKQIEIAPTVKLPPFVLGDGAPWTLADEQLLPKDERPETHFRLHGWVSDGILYYDASGRSETAEGQKGALLKRGYDGATIAISPILHDIYHRGQSADSAHVALMDASGVLHIYDGVFRKVHERDLQKDLRVKEHFRTTDTRYWGTFRSQIRAVDVNADGRCHLFTLADEAWCCKEDGTTLWGVRVPLNDGWERITVRGENVLRPPAAVIQALRILELELPVTLDEIKRQRRVLAMRYHPDRNPDNPNAAQLMQEVNDACAQLTGVDPEVLDSEWDNDGEEKTTFQQTDDQWTDYGGFRISFTSNWGAQDWVYAAMFTSSGSGAYLATYSGKVLEVDDAGKPVCVYVLGQIPHQIIESGPNVYLLTTTRLYVVRKRGALLALVDAYQQGQLLVTPAGFGFINGKRLQWFSPEGKVLGEVIARDPIRTVYAGKEGDAVLESRQHRVRVSGLSLLTC